MVLHGLYYLYLHVREKEDELYFRIRDAENVSKQLEAERKLKEEKRLQDLKEEAWLFKIYSERPIYMLNPFDRW